MEEKGSPNETLDRPLCHQSSLLSAMGMGPWLWRSWDATWAIHLGAKRQECRDGATFLRVTWEGWVLCFTKRPASKWDYDQCEWIITHTRYECRLQWHWHSWDALCCQWKGLQFQPQAQGFQMWWKLHKRRSCSWSNWPSQWFEPLELTKFLASIWQLSSLRGWRSRNPWRISHYLWPW